MAKRVKAKLYTFTRIKYTRELGLHYEELENNCLYSEAVYPTKITPDDLPAWFVKGRYYKNHGFLSAKGVIDLVYEPNTWINHMFRDDSLYISYKEPITNVQGDFFGKVTKEWQGYDYVIEGTYAVDFVAAVKKYSDFNTSEIEKAILDKVIYYKNKFPNEHESENADKILEDIQNKFCIS